MSTGAPVRASDLFRKLTLEGPVQPSYTTTAMNYDYALVTLANPATSGYLSLFFPPSNGTTENASLTTAGYPGSKPSGTMWSSACGNTPIDYSSNNAFANVQQCTSGVSALLLPPSMRTSPSEDLPAYEVFQQVYVFISSMKEPDREAYCLLYNMCPDSSCSAINCKA